VPLRPQLYYLAGNGQLSPCPEMDFGHCLLLRGCFNCTVAGEQMDLSPGLRITTLCPQAVSTFWGLHFEMRGSGWTAWGCLPLALRSTGQLYLKLSQEPGKASDAWGAPSKCACTCPGSRPHTSKCRCDSCIDFCL